jgi:hypothetical protein
MLHHSQAVSAALVISDVIFHSVLWGLRALHRAAGGSWEAKSRRTFATDFR